MSVRTVSPARCRWPIPKRQATGSTTVDRMFGEMAVSMYVYQPLGPRWIHAHGRDGAWPRRSPPNTWSTSTTPTAQRPGSRGRPSLEPSSAPPSWIGRRTGSTATCSGSISSSTPSRSPTAKPPLGAIYFDRSGRLWIEGPRPQATSRGRPMSMRETRWSRAIAGRAGPRPGDVPWGERVAALRHHHRLAGRPAGGEGCGFGRLGRRSGVTR